MDDNSMNIEVAGYLLEELGIEVVTAKNGLEAVSYFKQSALYEISLILMDVMMPVMDGIEATRRIRREDREDATKIPIIALTANAYIEDIRRVKEAGMNDHLAKPLEVERLYQILAVYLE